MHYYLGILKLVLGDFSGFKMPSGRLNCRIRLKHYPPLRKFYSSFPSPCLVNNLLLFLPFAEICLLPPSAEQKATMALVWDTMKIFQQTHIHRMDITIFFCSLVIQSGVFLKSDGMELTQTCQPTLSTFLNNLAAYPLLIVWGRLYTFGSLWFWLCFDPVRTCYFVHSFSFWTRRLVELIGRAGDWKLRKGERNYSFLSRPNLRIACDTLIRQTRKMTLPW